MAAEQGRWPRRPTRSDGVPCRLAPFLRPGVPRPSDYKSAPCVVERTSVGQLSFEGNVAWRSRKELVAFGCGPWRPFVCKPFAAATQLGPRAIARPWQRTRPPGAWMWPPIRRASTWESGSAIISNVSSEHDCRCASLPEGWPKCGMQTQSTWSRGCDGRALDAALRHLGFETRLHLSSGRRVGRKGTYPLSRTFNPAGRVRDPGGPQLFSKLRARIPIGSPTRS